MKFTHEAEDEADRVELELNFADTTIFMSAGFAAHRGRILQVSVRTGVFEALADGPKTAKEVSESRKLGTVAMPLLLDALATLDYVRHEGDRYALTEQGRRWMLGTAHGGFGDFVASGYVEMDWDNRMEQFLETDEPLDLDRVTTPEGWAIYERAQRALSEKRDGGLVERVPLPAGARDMLDLGAVHGQRAAFFLDAHPSLRAVVLGSPERIAAAAPLVEHSRMTRRPEDPKKAELGTSEYDLVLLSPSQLRLTTAETVDLVERCARALRPSGLLVVADFFRAKRASDNGQHAALLALFHEMTSSAGAVTTDDMAAWQRDAGLVPLPAIDILPRIHTCQIARKSS